MAKQNAIYKCEICDNVVSVIHSGQGELVCCGQEMKLLEEKTSKEEGNEKHVPLIETIDGGIRVIVGSIPHPMQENHYIELIQLIKDNKIIVEKRLSPDDDPVTEFYLADTQGLRARALCNVHGLWVN